MKRYHLMFLALLATMTTCFAQVSHEQIWQRHSEKMNRALEAFVHETEAEEMKVNDIIVMQHGKLLATWQAPEFAAGTSIDQGEASSTVTAIAIGMLIDEGRLSLDDKITKIFADEQPAMPDEKLGEMTVRHLLTMTTGHTGDMPVNSGTDWVREYLSQPLPYKPGSYFCYERMTGYMLSAIVQRISGQKLIDYLQPRLFEPLGIQSATWQESPLGINTGGWGLQASTQDMARIGTMLVQKGKWDGKRILSKAWIKQMMQYQTESSPRDVPLKDIVQSGLNDYENDWIQGFGYQMWLSRLNEFARAEDGNGKFLLVIPKYDAVVAINTDSEKMQSELNSVFYHISPALQEWRGKKEKRHRTDTTPHLHRM